MSWMAVLSYCGCLIAGCLWWWLLVKRSCQCGGCTAAVVNCTLLSEDCMSEVAVAGCTKLSVGLMFVAAVDRL